MARTGKVILAKNINMDREHNNVLTYTENQMLSLLRDNSHLVAEMDDCSFVGKDSTIAVKTSYANAIQSNYIAFQNPQHSNKWFFAFVRNCIYESNGTTTIEFEIDDFATWWDYWTPKACFVVREHAETDVPGDNLLPESLETGEYVQNLAMEKIDLSTTMYYVIMASQSPNGDVTQATDLGGIPTAGGIYVFQFWQQMVNALNKYASRQALEAVNIAYCVPASCFDGTHLVLHLLDGYAESDENVYYEYTGSSTPNTFTQTVQRPTSLNGYTPRNKKLLTAPFQKLVFSNGSGTVNSFDYEFFASTIQFSVKAIPTVGGSIFAYPNNYKGIADNYNEGLIAGKFPTLSWSGDAYTNWLTQSSVNNGLGLIELGGTIALGTALSATGLGSASVAGLVGGGIASVGSRLFDFEKQKIQRSIVPTTVRGNVNGGDIFTASKTNNYYIYHMSITAQFAERIDQYFDRMGYATNKIKIPNQMGRSKWNYVQIASSENIGYNSSSISVPPRAMENINNMYRSGVTLWHNHDEIGNFSLNNTIV